MIDKSLDNNLFTGILNKGYLEKIQEQPEQYGHKKGSK